MVRNILNSIVVHLLLALFIYINAKDIYYYETVSAQPINTISVKIIKNKEQFKNLNGASTEQNYLSPTYKGKQEIVASAEKYVKEKAKAKAEATKQIKPKLKKKPISKPAKSKDVAKVAAADVVKKDVSKVEAPKAKVTTEKPVATETIKPSADTDSMTRAKVVEGEPDEVLKAEGEAQKEEVVDTSLFEEAQSIMASSEEDSEQLERILEYAGEEEYDAYLEEEVERQIEDYRPVRGAEGYTNGTNLVGKNMMKLSLSERQGVQNNIQYCYKRAILKNKKDSDKVVTLVVQVNRDGYMNLNSVKVLGRDKYTSREDLESFDIAAENAKVALKECNPLRNLPQTKYRIWREMSLEFDSSEL